MGSETLRTRLLIGALGGLVATAAMTSVAQRLHDRLPPQERYPLPPRELNEAVFDADEDAMRDLTVATHFGFGAAAGALIAATAPHLGLLGGMASGIAVWTASYLGWAPAMRILKPLHRHPPRRSALMAAGHLVWGAVLSATMRELRYARARAFAAGRMRDWA